MQALPPRLLDIEQRMRILGVVNAGSLCCRAIPEVRFRLWPHRSKDDSTSKEERVRASTIGFGLLLVSGLAMAAGPVLSKVPAGVPIAANEVVLEAALSECSWADGEETLHYDGPYDGSVGLSPGGTFYSAARFTPTAGCTLKAVVFYQADASSNEQIIIWDEGSSTQPGAKLDSVGYIGSGESQWKRVNLVTPVVLGANTDFWVGPRITHAAGLAPLGVDAGPMIQNRGGWISLNGSVWEQLSDNGLDCNWNIRAIVVMLPPVEDDVGVTEIIGPPTEVGPGLVTPTALIQNFGDNAQTDIPVHCWIDSAGTHVYQESLVYAGPLAAGASDTVYFSPDWLTGPEGNAYDITMFTALSGDEFLANDTMYGTVTVFISGSEETLHVDGPYNNNAVGLTSGGTYIGAVRLTPTADVDLVAVIFYQHQASQDQYVFAWDQGSTTQPGAKLDSVPYTGAGTGWKRNDLTAPIPVSSGTDFWVGPQMTHAAGEFPLAVDAGPMVPNRGGFVYLNSWDQLANLGLDFNWNIRAIVRTGSGIEEELLPARHVLSPSPVCDFANISYNVGCRSRVNLSVYDARGSLVRTLVDGVVEPGERTATWDRRSSNGRRVAQGAYFYRLTVDGETTAGKAIVLD